MDPTDLLEVGRIVKPHGLTGEVVVELWTNVTERLAPGTELATERGPLTVVSSRPFQGRYLVYFADITDRSGADSLRGLALSAPPIDSEDTLWVHELVGAQAVAPDGTTLGTVVAVEANPASDLLVLDGGGLVPLHFVTDVEPGVRVVVDAPAGLLE